MKATSILSLVVLLDVLGAPPVSAGPSSPVRAAAARAPRLLGPADPVAARSPRPPGSQAWNRRLEGFLAVPPAVPGQPHQLTVLLSIDVDPAATPVDLSTGIAVFVNGEHVDLLGLPEDPMIDLYVESAGPSGPCPTGQAGVLLGGVEAGCTSPFLVSIPIELTLSPGDDLAIAALRASPIAERELLRGDDFIRVTVAGTGGAIVTCVAEDFEAESAVTVLESSLFGSKKRKDKKEQEKKDCKNDCVNETCEEDCGNTWGCISSCFDEYLLCVKDCDPTPVVTKT